MLDDQLRLGEPILHTSRNRLSQCRILCSFFSILVAALLGASFGGGSLWGQGLKPIQPAATAANRILPHAVPLPVSMPEPRDIPFPGDIQINVNATDVIHRILQVRESLPVKGGTRITLLFPQWTTGDHTPNGSLDKMAGLVAKAAGQRLSWERDPVQVYAFHIDIPEHATQLDLEYQFLSPNDRRSGATLINSNMLDLQWQTAILYPAGYYARDIVYRPSVVLPDGWQYASALDGGLLTNNVISFPRVALDTLVDSPLMAAKYLKQMTVSASPVPVRLDIAADSPEQLEGANVVAAEYAKVVDQAYKLFGARHYDHYDFMLWLSDDFGPVYYEHHRSGENSAPANYLAKYSEPDAYRQLMLHGYVHSWNGTFRRPAEMWAPNFNTPERDGLLWMSEGLTMYWQEVLSVRAGLSTAQDELDTLADNAARASIDAGAEWRPFQDVSYGPLIAFRKAEPWNTWQRGMFNAYSEGELTWLEVDLMIRTQTHDRRSLDDFARSFFGQNDGSYATETYSFSDVIDALQALAPYDWNSFFHNRLVTYSSGMSFAGIAQSGYKITYEAEPVSPETGDTVDLTFSLGMIVGAKGSILAVHWKGPAFQAGAIPNESIIAINSKPYSPERLRAAVRNTAQGQPITLTLQNGGVKETISVMWTGGLRYPHLTRTSSKDAALDEILKAVP